MKKAKFFLSAAGLLSVIAGAVAFKAQHRFEGTYSCYTSLKKVTVGGYTTTASGGFVNTCINPSSLVTYTTRVSIDS